MRSARPIGRRNGTLAAVRADDLAADVLNGLIGRVGLDPATIEDVQMGCVTQIGEQGAERRPGRRCSSPAGPRRSTATTVDRQCGSSMQAAFNAAAAIQAGHLDVVVAAGVESMSRVPMGSNLGAEGFAGLNEKIAERWPIVPQGISAEEIAKEWGLSREDLDAYSLESNRRAIAAIDAGLFEREIVPIDVCRDGGAFTVDETPRRDTSAEKLASLQARVHRGRRRHGRQLEPDRRRGCRDAGRERGSVGTGSVSTPRGAVRLVRARGRRPVPDAARQPAGVRGGAAAGRASTGTTSR